VHIVVTYVTEVEGKMSLMINVVNTGMLKAQGRAFRTLTCTNGDERDGDVGNREDGK